MHNNYYFLRRLTSELEKRLAGFAIVSCFSQNKDELVIEFNNSTESFFFRADLSASFCCLSFPNNFARAGKNSVDLFQAVALQKVTGLKQFENERSFLIQFENDHSLLFKMHGNRANIILFQQHEAIEIFRHHLKADLELNPQQLDRKIDWTKDFFLAHQDNLAAAYFTLGKPVWDHLAAQGFAGADAETKWKLFQSILQELQHPEYWICTYNGKLAFLLFEMGEVVKTISDPVKAITEFYFMAMSTRTLFTEKHSALSALNAIRISGEAYLKKNRDKLLEIEHDGRYKLWADLIMAHVYKIAPGVEIVSLENFHDNNIQLEIPLKKTLSPQKNAEVYYRKSKNQQIEVQKLKESIRTKENELSDIAVKIQLLEAETSIKGLRQRMAETGILEKSAVKQPELLPYREVEFRGFKIWIGRNAESNDKLTQKYSYKDDLWLHAKDVAGSHVLLKHQSGKIFPKEVIERAAQLAAWNSKRKNEALCPVAYTFKKYVRKRKGDQAGMVVVEREEVILVEPTL